MITNTLASTALIEVSKETAKATLKEEAKPNNRASQARSINIKPLKAFSDNYIWTLICPVDADNSKAIAQERQEIVVIDPGQAQPVIDFIEGQNAQGINTKLVAICITHKHPDHIGGVRALKKYYPDVKVIAHPQHNVSVDQAVGEGSEFSLWGNSVKVWQVAGHTEHHLAYLVNTADDCHVFCGDTLFSGGCGRVFTGDMNAMCASLLRLASVPIYLNDLAGVQQSILTDEQILFYPAHEYTASNLRFGLYVEPNNQAMQRYLQLVNDLQAKGIPSLPSTLASEKQINVFLRVAEPSVITGLCKHIRLADTSPVTVFTGLRTLKDSF